MPPLISALRKKLWSSLWMSAMRAPICGPTMRLSVAQVT
jgi:hypothetical protein